MKYYKEVLLKELVNSGWKLITQDDDTDWWLEEVWEIQSVMQSWGMQLFIHFLVDLQYEGDNKSSAVWLVTANSSKALDYSDAQNDLAELLLRKGHFNENIRSFIKAINDYRNIGSYYNQKSKIIP